VLELTEQGQDNQKRKVIQSGQAPSLLSLATFKRFFGFQENKVVKALSYLPSLTPRKKDIVHSVRRCVTQRETRKASDSVADSRRDRQRIPERESHQDG
jgi:hypothetical protein